MNTSAARDLDIAFNARMADADARNRPGIIRSLAALTPVAVLERRALSVDRDDADREHLARSLPVHARQDLP